MDIKHRASGFVLSPRVRRQIDSNDFEERFLFWGETEPAGRLQWDQGGRYLSVRFSTSIDYMDWLSTESYELTWDGEKETVDCERRDWTRLESPFPAVPEARLPDGRHRVTIDRGRLVLATHDGEVVRLFEEAPGGVLGLAVSHDARVLFAAVRKGCWIGRLESGKTLSWISGPICDVAAHPSNRTFATVDVRRDLPRVVLRLWELDNDALRSTHAAEAFRMPPDAWNLWRIVHSARRTVLSRINGSMRNLMEIDLRDTRLDGANLRRSRLGWSRLDGADLRNADLTEADLTGASLRGANLTEARLAGARLRNADLSGATLFGADLTGAKLDNTEFSEATMGWTVLGSNDLSRARGLDKVGHKGPSVLGLDTLRTLPDPLPQDFLRGCGVSTPVMERLPALVAADRTAEYYSCFISYSHTDRAFARRLQSRLQEFDVTCWLDDHQLYPGDNIYEGVDRGIRLWDKMLLCASRASLTSWWVDNEIGIAFEKEQQLSVERGERVNVLIPLDLDGYLTPGEWRNGKAAEIRQRLAADFRGWETDDAKFEKEFQRVLRALRIDPHARAAPPVPRL